MSEASYGYKKGDIIKLATNPTMMLTDFGEFGTLFTSIICLLSNLSLSWKQCNGLWALLRHMILYLSHCKPAPCIIYICSHSYSRQTPGTMVRSKMSTDLMVLWKVVLSCFQLVAPIMFCSSLFSKTFAM